MSRGELGRIDLHRDLSAVRADRAADDAHAALAEGREEPVRADALGGVPGAVPPAV